MNFIFVTHATADDEPVTRIHDALEALTGQNLWVDHQDLKLPNPNFRQTIQNALLGCDAGLLILSRNSTNRPEIEAEWNYILANNRPLLIAIIDDLPIQQINYRLSIIQWLDLHKDWDAGIQALAAAIRGEPLPDNAPFTLPRPVTGHIDRRLTAIPLSGRDSDVEAIKRLLQNGPVAILGMGGLGKSRLAAEILMTSEGINGAIWHTASDISRPDEVIELLREHFKLESHVDRKAVLANLRTNKRLVVLDNAESVSRDDPRRLEYVQLVDDLCDARALVLLTSRVAWDDIQLCEGYTPKTLILAAARQIVIDMGKVWNIAHELSAQADEIAEVARLHPRLIEWGIRQMKRFPPDKVIHDLRGLKSKAAQDALDEMILKTLRQMSEQDGSSPSLALRSLNVCRGGFTYEATVAITNWDDQDLLDRALSTLQAWQFMAFDGQRYMVDTLVIEAIGEDERAYIRHYDYYLRLSGDSGQNQDENTLRLEANNFYIAIHRVQAEKNYKASSKLLDNIRGKLTLLLRGSSPSQQIAWLRVLENTVYINCITIGDLCLELARRGANIQKNLSEAYKNYTQALELINSTDASSDASVEFINSIKN